MKNLIVRSLVLAAALLAGTAHSYAQSVGYRVTLLPTMGGTLSG